MADLDILIIDDDDMVAELSRSVLQDDKYTIETLNDSTQAIEKISKLHPRLIITDIMMPGFTGMDICKAVKMNPQLKDIKVIVMSGKSFAIEKQRAMNFGAEYYIQKPYDIPQFRKDVAAVLAGTKSFSTEPPPVPEIPQNASASPTESTLADNQLKLTIWGARGFSPVIPNSTSVYGRQTSCVSVETKNSIFIFDAGTGIIELGKKIVSEKRYYKDIWIMITHFHIDHILGLSEFEPLYDPHFSIHLVGASDPERTLHDMAQSSIYSSFSLHPIQPKAAVDVNEIQEDEYELAPGVLLEAVYANHPTSTVMYKLSLLGREIVYAPDSEIWEDASAFQDYNEKTASFLKNTEILIHDAAIKDSDYEKLRSRGHSSVSNIVNFAIDKTPVKELILFHALAEYSDDTIDEMMLDAMGCVSAKNAKIVCHMAKEKQEFLLKGK
jgi:CheY-like chemotaxis protein